MVSIHRTAVRRWVLLSANLLLFSMISVSEAATQELPPSTPDLRGLVERMVVTEEVVEGSAASAQGEESRRQVFEFEEGRLVGQDNYVPSDELAWESTFEYGRDGRVVSWTARDDGGQVKWQYEYAYDAQGRIEREVTRDGAGQIQEVLVYDYVEGRLAEETRYGPGNSVQWRKTYSYDQDGRSRTWSVFYPDGTRLKQVDEEYDERDRLVKETHRDGIGTVSMEIIYEYGLWPTPRSIEVFGGDGSLKRREERFFDAAGNVVEERVVRSGTDDRIEVVREYSYDRRGNWITERTLHLEVSGGARTVTREKVTRRKISYAGDE